MTAVIRPSAGSSAESAPHPQTMHAIERRCQLALGVLVVAYVCVFLRFTFGIHDSFATRTYDLSIFDQAAWLISRGEEPFVTVRGQHILGDHFSPLLFLLAPLYWFLDSPRALLAAQTVALR